MKKTLWATVLLLVCAILLSSCGSKNEKQPSDDTTNNTQETHTHSFEEWITIKKTSCTEDGTNERYCACGEKQVQTISAFGHTEIVDNAINSTCQTNGKSEGKHCSVCGVVIIEQTSLPLANHTYDNENDEKCNICGYERYASCKHLNTKAIEAVEATCTASGLTEGSKCVDCGEILVAQVATSPKGHISTTVKGYDSTCKQTGLTDSVKCSICNIELETAIIIPVKPHEYTDKYDESCNQCGFIRDAECAHINTSVIPGKNATCTEAGLTEGKECTKCGETLVAQTTIGKLGHVEVIDAAVSATCTTDGKTEGKHCSRCNETLIVQNVIGKLGHNEEIDAAIPASCVTEGKTEGKHCTRCGEITVAQTIVKATNHNYVNNICNVCNSIRAGLYDKNNYLVASWEELVNTYGLDIQEDYRIGFPNHYEKSGGSMYYVLSNNEELTAGVSLIIDDSIDVIGSYAFYKCESLISVTLSSNITQIGQNAFASSGITTLNFTNNSKLEIIGSRAFLGSNLKDIVFPNNVISIGYQAFYYCRDLQQVTFNDNSRLEVIDESAFEGCSSLKTVRFGNLLASIGTSAFEECKSLTEINIPNSVKSIGSSAFYGCKLLQNVSIPESVTTVGSSAFSNCTSLISISVPNSVKSISHSTFFGCSSLEQITLGEYLMSIGDFAFCGCSSLKSISLPESLISIGTAAFADCTLLEEVSIPNSTKSIDSAFGNCPSLKYNEYDNALYLGNDNNLYHALIKLNKYDISSCEINSETKVIAGGAFNGASNITQMVIPNAVISIGKTSFWNCKKLSSISIGKSVTEIGEQAFLNCSSLTNVIFAEDAKLETIGYEAFSKCSSLVNIRIPTTVTYIGKSAFVDCLSLDSIILENTSGWMYMSSSTSTSGTQVSSSDLLDPNTVAQYFTSDYSDYYWKRN